MAQKVDQVGSEPVENVIVVDHVSAGYGTSTVLRDVSLKVRSGSVVALLGPNGAGKTTLLRAISGLLRPAQGKVVVAGRDVTHADAYAVARTGLCLVPEGRGIFRELSVRENLRLQVPAWRGSSASATIDDAVDAFPILGRRMKQVAGSLSGGEQQMLALARATLSGASVVLLDEVSMGLAPKVVDEIMDSIARLAETGVSLLLVEQYVARALEMADFVYLLTRGSVTFAGLPSELDADDLAQRYLGGTAVVE
jgi:branched-chain amino acid transport system ATP-binding protein